MDWNDLEAGWEKVAAAMKAKWGALTDDDLRYVDRNRDALVAKVRGRTGLEINTAERQLDWLIAGLSAAPGDKAQPVQATIPPAGAKPPTPV